MKIITVETLKKFLDELNKKYGTEFYSKTECDERYQQKGESSGGDVDYQELARRIPAWQWKVIMPKTQFGIITATVGGAVMAKSEKDKEVDFYAPQGSVVKFAIEKRNKGTTAEEMSATEVTLTSDFTLTVKGGGGDSPTNSPPTTIGILGIDFSKSDFPLANGWSVPDGVSVLKVSTKDGRTGYVRVRPGQQIFAQKKEQQLHNPEMRLVEFDIGAMDSGSYIYWGDDKINVTSGMHHATIEWSPEINSHPVDVDFTRYGQSKYIVDK